MENNLPCESRREFLKKSAAVATTFFVPTIVPASVFGPNAPSNRITIGAIGTGRISREHDLPEIWKYDHAQVVAVCDLDSKRVQNAKQLVEKHYTDKKTKRFRGVKTYEDYQELLGDKKIDAVVISTPDHWHAIPAIHAAAAGKDIYLQKPTSLTIAEGRLLSNHLRKTDRIFQIGSQQRSLNPWPQFKRVCELVRNGRIGKLTTVYVGLPGDPSGTDEPEMPVPANLNYNRWLGSTPEVYYTEKRVHPQADYSRPGWLRCEQFGAGMITGWGSHHVDIAHWGMDTEYTGPVEVSGWAEFPSGGLWNVHGKFQTEALYAHGVKMIVSNELPNGVKFEGTDGWVFVTRGSGVTASDPSAAAGNTQVLNASNPSMLSSVIGPDEIHLYESPDQHGNWLDSIRSRKPPVTNVEIAHRSCSACLVHHIAMKLKRKVYWDPEKEQFKDDEEANRMLSRPMRAPYQIAAVN